MFWWHLKNAYALKKLSGRNGSADDGYAIICTQAHKIVFRMHISFTCTCTPTPYIYIYIYISKETQNKLQHEDVTF